MLAIRLLGQFGIRRDDESIELTSRPAQSLLAYLLLNPGIEYRREKLAGVIWPDSAEDNARTYLRQALWRIRKAIGDIYLLADRVTVAFNTKKDIWLDVDVLEKSLEAGWTVDSLEKALEVYEGELLPGFYDDWVVRERERFQALYEQRIRQLLNRMIEDGRWDKVLHWGEKWIAQGHVPEPAYRALMIAHIGLGDLSGMANAYQRCVQALEEELGVEPSGETKRLYKDLKEGRGPAGERSGLAAGLTSTGLTPSKGTEEPSLVPPAFLTGDQAIFPEREELFIGREQELNALDTYLQSAMEGHGRVAFITGEAGQGKTTLLREFVRRAQVAHPRVIVTNGACPVYTPVCAPYGLFREVLEMLTGNVEPALVAGSINREQARHLWQLIPLVIELLLQHGPHLLDTLVSAEELVARARFAGIGPEQMERLKVLTAHAKRGDNPLSEQGALFTEYADFLIALSNKQPLLVILDDLHWSDPSSIGLLGHLGHRLPEGAILLAAAYRPEEITQGREDKPHPLVPVLSEYKRRFGQILIKLDKVEADNGRTFIDALLDEEANALDDSFRQALTRHTNGHPLFTVELLREMRERGALAKDEAGRWVVSPEFDWDVIPARVEGIIETRLSHLDQELRQWLDLASVEGEIFTAEVIAKSVGIEANLVVNQLSHELDRRYRLVKAKEIQRVDSKRLSRYHFRHSLFRQYLYQQLDTIERSYLHQQVGETLEQLYEPKTSEIADQLAHHFQMANLAEKTAKYLEQAGDNAARAYAYDEAKSYYLRALEFATESDAAGALSEEKIGLFAKLGRILEHNAEIDKALGVYQEMERFGRSHSNQPVILKALTAQAILYSIPSPVHAPKQSQVISEEALILAQKLGDRSAEARVLWNLIPAYGYDNQPKKAIEFGERSLELSRRLNDQRQLAFTLSDLAGWYWNAGQIARANELSLEAIEIWRASGNLPMLADVLIQSSYARLYGGDYDEAVAFSDEAWGISQSIGNKWNLAFSRSRIGFVHRARGELGRSIAVAEESLRSGKRHDLPNPQIFAGAELAFDFAYLGVTDLGIKRAQQTLAIADQRVPLYRPHLLAALAQNRIVSGDLKQAEAAIQQARSDPSWQAAPVLCIALILADGRLALARKSYEQALKLTDELLDQLRGFGTRAYLPEALDLSGQVLLGLGRGEEAQSRFIEALKEAEEMGAKGYSWSILFHLSQSETEPEQATHLRQKAREIVEFIADNTGRPSYRDSFLLLPEVQAIVKSTR